VKRTEIIAWLKETNPDRLERLWRQADDTRRQCVGDEIHLRGLVEIGNYCVRSCGYCGLSVQGSHPQRYRMSESEIMDCAHQAETYGYGTAVLQAGEDPGLTAEFVESVVRRIKTETSLAVTLSLGERRDDELARWRAAGADRYLLRFETSDPELYETIHPSLPGVKSDRFALLKRLRSMGYEIGSGVMIGIPGQTWEMLATDIEMFAELDLDMIGVGPYIAHPDTPLGRDTRQAPDGQQAANTEKMTYKVVALARLVCPAANIPSTTALATLNLAQGRELGLQRGANVVMPNLTPVQYREFYEIYPAKACIRETSSDCRRCMNMRILSIGRVPGTGRGDSPNYQKKARTAE